MISLSPREYNTLEHYFHLSSDDIFKLKDEDEDFDLPLNLRESGCLCASAFFAISCELLDAFGPDTEIGSLDEILVSTMELRAIQEYYTNSSHFLLDLVKKKKYVMSKELGAFAIATGNILNEQWKKLEEDLTLEDNTEV